MKIVVMLVVFFLLAAGLSVWLFLDPQSTLPTYFAKPVVTPTPLSSSIHLNENALFENTNTWRVSQNLSQYIKDDDLCSIAKDRVTNDKWMDSHAGLVQKYKKFPSALAENLGVSASNEKLLRGWLSSSQEEENLKKPYKYSCVACKNYYCTQIFSNLEYGGWEESRNVWKNIKIRSDYRGCCSWSPNETTCNKTTRHVVCGDGQESPTCKC